MVQVGLLTTVAAVFDALLLKGDYGKLDKSRCFKALAPILHNI
jgi:hypothetical protein